MYKNAYYILIAIAALILLSFACGPISAEKLPETVVPSATARIVAVGPVQEPGADVREAPPRTAPNEISSAETPLPAGPTPSPTPTPEALNVVKSGFWQDDQSAGYAFLAENPNQGLAIQNSQYQVTAYDENNTPVESETGYIDLLGPGQTLGISGDMYLDEGVTIEKIEVLLDTGDAQASEPVPAFTVENTAYLAGDYTTYVTGKVTNPYDTDISSLRVSAILYDEAGNIIGGGYAYIGFLLANRAAGAQVSVAHIGEIASAVLYPTLSSISLLLMDEDAPSENVPDIRVNSSGFGQDDYSVGVGMLLENSNADYAIESSEYHITAYAADGTVIDTDHGYIHLLLPEQVLGVASELYLNSDVVVDHVDIQIMAGEFVEAAPTPSFIYENAAFQADDFFNQVTGVVLSSYASDISDLRVTAIAYDESGAIIGGGYTYLDLAPANGKAEVEIYVTVAGTPAKVEIYATVTSLSEFGD